MNAIAQQRKVSDIVAEYEAKAAALEDELGAFHSAVRRLESATCVSGQYGGPIWGRSGCAPSVWDTDAAKALLISGWKAIYDHCEIERIASAEDKKRWEAFIADPAPLTREAAFERFGDYLVRTRFHILRGLAECFVQLDPAYKSHSKVKIGVSGLPKRVILRWMRGVTSAGYDRLRDILNALAAYRGEMVVGRDELTELDRLSGILRNTAGEVTVRGQRVQVYQNGNAHLIFDKAALRDINMALAEFYGEVLPDVEEPNAKPQPGTAVAKDLQFYWTPPAVIQEVLDKVGVYRRDQVSGRYHDEWTPDRVLEPSCGDGRILDEIRKRGHRSLGVEVHAGRAAGARAKGHSVLTANFLETIPDPVFDFVVMNPPFYGEHWKKHVAHALKCLKPGGRLAAILPATAEYDHDVTSLFGGSWYDLPVASFAAAGTNVPTGYIVTTAR